jgi:hypothetical protein
MFVVDLQARLGRMQSRLAQCLTLLAFRAAEFAVAANGKTG